MSVYRSCRCLAWILSVCTLLAAAPTEAQSYPSKPVRLIATYPPGGSSDLMARILARRLSEMWSQQVLVENKPGAAGSIGMEYAAHQPADGYAFVIGNLGPVAVNPLISRVPYDVLRDFVPVSMICTGPNILVVNASSPLRSLQDVVSAAREKPGALNFGSGGTGSLAHLAGEMLKRMARVDITHVPYKGAAPAAAAVLAGEVSMFCGPIAQGLASYRAGRLRAVGITGAAPSPLVPELAPLAATYPGLVVSDFYAVFAPSGIPDAILESLRSDLRGVWEDAGLRERLGALGIDALWLDGAGLSRRIEADLAKWSRVVKAAGIKAE